MHKETWQERGQELVKKTKQLWTVSCTSSKIPTHKKKEAI